MYNKLSTTLGSSVCPSNILLQPLVGYQSAVNANIAGAHRVELCSEISVGGTTPSYGLLKKVMADIDIPIHVLIRPRSGNFTYSDKEFDIMKENIRLCKDLNCAGIVSGVLHEDNTIDVKRTSELIELSKPMSFTFHRATRLEL